MSGGGDIIFLKLINKSLSLDNGNHERDLSPPQRPLSYCFDRKSFLAVGLGRERNSSVRGML